MADVGDLSCLAPGLTDLRCHGNAAVAMQTIPLLGEGGQASQRIGLKVASIAAKGND